MSVSSFLPRVTVTEITYRPIHCVFIQESNSDINQVRLRAETIFDQFHLSNMLRISA